LLPGAVDDIWLALSFLVPLGLLFALMPSYLRLLTRRGKVVDDVHKIPPTKVPSPVGPVLLVCLVAGEALAYVYWRSLVPPAIIGAILIAFIIGFADDLFVLGGKTKPLLLVLPAVPLLLAQELQPGVYHPALYFPFLGQTSEHFFIYSILIVAAIPVVSNAYNMMDSFNGEISGFALLTSIAVAIGILLRAYALPGYSPGHLVAALPMVGVALGFYFYNRYPSRAFDGDSGSLVFGTMFAALAVTGGVEIAAVVAIIPAILNSFYILASLRGFVERRRMSARPTYMAADAKLYASDDPEAPTTLVRMILLEGPLTESELVRRILILTAVSCLLSVITSVLTWVL
jgi:UDP-N-acetylglucosamine--dolichyl-phosphate N-acetylglucosaminephosphotransferase